MSCSKQATPALFDMPLPALELILKHSHGLGFGYHFGCRKHHPLFLVSREGRDAVIQTTSKITIMLDKSDNSSNSGPLARLLNRVCSHSGAKPGLKIVLNGEAVPSKAQGDLLASLLKPTAGCWPAVKRLKLADWSSGMAAGYLIGPCFPCITKLTLKAVNLEHGEVLSGLLCSRVPLSCLKLTHCSMSASVVPALAALLTTLPLKELHVREGENVAGLAEGQCKLTRATITSKTVPSTQILQYAGNMTQLQHLTAGGKGPCDSSALQQAMSAYAHLTSLQITSTVDQQGLDVLLAHASCLNSVTFGTLDLSEDRSAAPCTWQHLRWHGSCDIRPFAYLPVHSAQTWAVHWPEVGWDLHFPGGYELCLPVGAGSGSGTSGEQLLILIHQAALNMSACPALCGTGAPKRLMLSYGCFVTDGQPQPPDAPFNSRARAQMVQALAPLAASRVHTLSVDMPGFQLGQQELAAIEEVFGQQIKYLHLSGCQVEADFWPAVAKAAPFLGSIEVIDVTSGKVTGAISESDLMVFCSHIDRPFTLSLLDDDIIEAGIDIEKLERMAALWESPVVISMW